MFDSSANQALRFASVSVYLAMALTLVLPGCADNDVVSPPSDDRPIYEQSGPVGPGGGIVRISDMASPLHGVAVDVPAGALAVETEIGIHSAIRTLSFEGDTTLTIVELRPDGLSFAIPVRVTLPWPAGATAPENLVAYAWEDSTDLWRCREVVAVDDAERLLTCETAQLGRMTAARSQIALATQLHSRCERISAAARLTMPLADVPTDASTCLLEGACNVETLMQLHPLGVVAHYRLTLMRLDGARSTALATRCIELGIAAKDGERYRVQARDESGQVLLESPSLLFESTAVYLQGTPVLFVFATVDPEPGAEYWVDARLYFITRFGGEIGGAGWCAQGFSGGSAADALTVDAMSAGPDNDCDGIVDEYDPGSSPRCDVSPTFLDFGEITPGYAHDLRFYITNTGAGVLEGSVISPCDDFTLVAGGGPYALLAGEQREVVVRFTPVSIAISTCMIEAGYELCRYVHCTGRGPNPPPAAITDLEITGVTSESIDIGWTAPGADEHEGTASLYDVRYATFAITEGNWYYASDAPGAPTPGPAGTSESMTIGGLEPDTTYWVAVKTADEVPSWSPLSTVASATTASGSRQPTPAELRTRNAAMRNLPHARRQPR